MTLHRIRARLRFTTASGMATWARDNMVVRYGQAVHVNAGLANEESKRNEIASDGANNEVFECDLPLMNEAAAVDAYSTLTAPSIRGHMVPFDVEQETAFVEHHTCGHDESPPVPCVVVSRHEVVESGGTEWQAGVSYAINDEVTYQDASYRCIQSHTSQIGWEPPNVPALWEAA